VQTAVQEARAYCGAQHTSPPFAALGEAARQKVLLRVAQASGIDLSPTAAVKSAEPVGTWLITGVARRWVPDSKLQTGALLGSLTRETVSQLCGASGARDWLQSSCSPLPEASALVELRDRLVVDVVQLPRRAWQRSGQSVPPDIEVVLQLLDTLSSGLDVEGLLTQLAEPRALAASLERCAIDAARASAEEAKRQLLVKTISEVRLRADRASAAARLAAEEARLASEEARRSADQARAEAEAQLAQVTNEVARLTEELATLRASAALPTAPELSIEGDPRAIALEIARRLLADGADFSRDPVHYRQIVIDVLRRAKLQLKSGDEKVIDALVGDWKTLREAQRALLARADDREAFRRGAEALLEGIERSLYLAGARAVPSSSHEFVSALIAGEIEKALTEAISMSAQAMNKPIPDEVEEVVECASGVLRAPNDAARKSALLACTVLPPWAKPFIFDANVGALSYEPGDYRLAGDATLGYNGLTWGAVAHGYASDYDLSTQEQLDQTEQRGGRVDLWGATRGSDSPWRFEGRVSGGGDYHDTSSTRRTTAGTVFFDQRSILLKGLLIAGVRHQTSTTALGIWAGGGPQYELYEPDTFSARSVQGITLTSDEHLAARFTGRLRGEYRIWPSYLTTRVRLDVDAYEITRQTEVITNATGSFVTTSTEAQAQQLEINARWFLDVEALRLLDFVPGAGVGFNYFFRTQAEQTESSFLPIAAVGLRREVF
jgi:hypothetical protein